MYSIAAILLESATKFENRISKLSIIMVNHCRLPTPILQIIFIILLMSVLATGADDQVKPMPFDTDIRRLTALFDELQSMADEMAFLQQNFGVNYRGYYTSGEHDKIEFLLFRFLAVRDALWDLVNTYRDCKLICRGDATSTRAFIIALNAAQNDITSNNLAAITTSNTGDTILRRLMVRVDE